MATQVNDQVVPDQDDFLEGCRDNHQHELIDPVFDADLPPVGAVDDQPGFISYSLSWLADVLRSAGCAVSEDNGWKARGRGEMGEVAGVICHHTAGPKTGNMPSMRILKEGRTDIPGPLSQLGLGRDGTFYVIAAGRSNHGGRGEWRGVSGNSRFIGIEAENSGQADDPWPLVQMEAYRKGVTAILRHLGLNESSCCGHKEYALPEGRKNDPSFSMDQFRSDIRAAVRA